jgi:hypothetical protein
VEEQAARHGLGQIENAPARGWLDRLTQVSDRMLEPALRGPGGAMWSQMKLNAQRASEHAQGGVRQMVAQLRRLQKERPELEIHLMGHSAGAILLGAMLPLLQSARLTAASLRLFAPACTVRFALDHLRPALQKKVLAPERLSLHVLSDANEQDDSVGPYRKSLLYLVSRAFEDVHKMPLLGMARAFDPASAQPRAADDLWAADRLAELRQWQAFWATQAAAGARLEVLSARSVRWPAADPRQPWLLRQRGGPDRPSPGRHREPGSTRQGEGGAPGGLRAAPASAAGRLGQAEDPVEGPGETHGVKEEQGQQADLRHQGLPQRDVQPDRHQRHQHQAQAALEADAVHQPTPHRALAPHLAPLPVLEAGVEDVVPGQGDAGHDHRQQQGRPRPDIEGQAHDRAGQGDGAELVEHGLEHAALQGVMEGMGPRA